MGYEDVASCDNTQADFTEVSPQLYSFTSTTDKRKLSTMNM